MRHSGVEEIVEQTVAVYEKVLDRTQTGAAHRILTLATRGTFIVRSPNTLSPHSSPSQLAGTKDRRVAETLRRRANYDLMPFSASLCPRPQEPGR